MIKRELLEEILDEVGIDLVSDVRWDYSGRGMYGRTCFGFVGDNHLLVAFFAELGRHQGWFDESGDDDRYPDLDVVLSSFQRALTTDNMGLNTIFYFPGVEIVEEYQDVDPDHVRDVALDAKLGIG